MPLDGDKVSRVVANGERKWTVVMYQIEAIVHAQPDDLDARDDYYVVLLEAGLLETRGALDDLVEDSIETEYDEPDEQTLPDLAKLLERLERCRGQIAGRSPPRFRRCAATSYRRGPAPRNVFPLGPSR
jgi:hypothetical protein